MTKRSMKISVVYLNLPYAEIINRVNIKVISMNELVEKSVFENLSQFKGERIYIGKISGYRMEIFSKPYYPGPYFLKTPIYKLLSVWTFPAFLFADIRQMTDNKVEISYRIEKQTVVKVFSILAIFL